MYRKDENMNAMKLTANCQRYGNKSGISFTYQSSNGNELAFSLHNQLLRQRNERITDMMKSFAARQRYGTKSGISYPYQPGYVPEEGES